MKDWKNLKQDNLDARSGVYEITPEMAQALLDTPGAKNRKLSNRRIGQYCSAIRNHQWVLTGEPILLDEKGNLLDGQHRLMACVQTTKPFHSVVLYGKFHFKDMGQGKPRSGSDVLSIRDVNSAVTIASAIRYIILHDRGMKRGAENPFVDPGGYDRVKKNGFNKSLDWTFVQNHDIDTFEMKSNPNIGEVLRTLRRAVQDSSGPSLVPLAPAVAAYYLALNSSKQKDRDEAPEWFAGLMSGANLGLTDQRRLFRNQMAKIKMATGDRAIPLKSTTIFGDIAYAWENRNKEAKRFSRKPSDPMCFIS